MQIRRTIPKSVRFRIFVKANFCCTYCGGPGGPLVIDHVIPVSLGGSNDEANLVASCTDCNIGKGASNVVGSGGTFLGGCTFSEAERIGLETWPTTTQRRDALCWRSRQRIDSSLRRFAASSNVATYWSP